jgi:adenylosuccinate synthase
VGCVNEPRDEGVRVSGTVVVGLQWGDEAKGKLVDLLTPAFDIVARYQGGANAGHTVVADSQTYKLHQIPSGILNPHVTNVISAGVVLNPRTALEEIDGLARRGIDVTRNLLISDRAHVVFPWHIEEDRLLDQATADGENIGTTLRGIGPCYRDKVGRSLAVRMADLVREDLETRIAKIVEAKLRILQGMTGSAGHRMALDAAAIYAEYRSYADRLRPLVADTTAYLLNAVERGQRILFEGAQGSLLDIDHGTYPFVTSSNSSGVGVSSGSGVPGRWIAHTLGVIKCYSTRVGGGPFPTEQENEAGELIRQRGREYGTTTGRPRRCGWFDAVAARYAARLSGADGLAVMMMDVLSALPEIQVCVAYDIDGERVTDFPAHVDDLRKARPIYETLPGWRREVTDVRQLNRLPAEARGYLDRLAELLGCPVEYISVGPDREQTIRVERTVSAAAG